MTTDTPSTPDTPTTLGTAGAPLDVAVRAALRAANEADVPRPTTLVLLATGLGLLPERLTHSTDLNLGDLEGTPERWHGVRLWAGDLDGHPVWLLEDVATDPRPAPNDAPWQAAFPVWLAAATGAQLMIHASAGAALSADGPLEVGSFALASDHINVSGETPLLGLGESSLGPLFPDLSRLHHPALRRAAQERAAALGLTTAEAVVACTRGPAIETPAERRYLERAGADACVQGLAAPLLAAAHAGLRTLALVAIADRGPGPTRLRDTVAAAGAAEAALEDLLRALIPDLEATARAAREEL